MPVGIEVRNNYGTYLISAEFSNYVFLKKQVVTFSPQFGQGRYVASSIKSVLAFKHDSTNAVGIIIGTDNLTHFFTSYSGTGNLTVYEFVPNSEITSLPNFGIAIYKADGKVAYHSSYKPLKILQVLNPYYYPVNYSPPAGKVIAYLPEYPITTFDFWNPDPTPEQGTTTVCGMGYFNENGLMRMITNVPAVLADGNHTNAVGVVQPKHMLIDVTGY